MATTNYVPFKNIMTAAARIGFEASPVDLLSVSTGRAAKLFNLAEKLGLKVVAKPIIAALQDNVILLLRKNHAPKEKRA